MKKIILFILLGFALTRLHASDLTGIAPTLNGIWTFNKLTGMSSFYFQHDGAGVYMSSSPFLYGGGSGGVSESSATATYLNQAGGVITGSVTVNGRITFLDGTFISSVPASIWGGGGSAGESTVATDTKKVGYAGDVFYSTSQAEAHLGGLLIADNTWYIREVRAALSQGSTYAACNFDVAICTGTDAGTTWYYLIGGLGSEVSTDTVMGSISAENEYIPMGSRMFIHTVRGITGNTMPQGATMLLRVWYYKP